MHKSARVPRTLSKGTEKVCVGRYCRSECQPLSSVADAQSSAAPVGFRTKVISRQHCEFWCEDGKWYIKDTRSFSGTFLNGIRLSPASQESMASQVFDGDIVQLGVNVERGGEYGRCVEMMLKLSHDWPNKPTSPSISTNNPDVVGESVLQTSTFSMTASNHSFDETDNANYYDDQSLGGPHIKDHAQEQGIDPSAKPWFWQTCFFCGDAYCGEIEIPSGPIEPVPCQHWLCHSCLMERFALAIVFDKSIIQCCGQAIPLRLFRRILVDPEVNELTLSLRQVSAKSSVYHRFICTLLRNRPFASVDIANQIRNFIGDDAWRSLVESASMRDGRQLAEDDCLSAERDQRFVRRSELPKSSAAQDANCPYVPAAAGGGSDLFTPIDLPPDQRYAASPEEIFHEFMKGPTPWPLSSQQPFSETMGVPIGLHHKTADGDGWYSTRSPPGYQSGWENDKYTGCPRGVPHQPPSSDRAPMNQANAAHAWRVSPLADEPRRPPQFERSDFQEDDVRYANYLPVHRERELRATTPFTFSDGRYSPHHDGEREGRISTQEPERLVPPLAAAPCAPRPDGMDARGPVADDVRRGGRLPRGRGRSRFLPQMYSASDSGSSTHDFVYLPVQRERVRATTLYTFSDGSYSPHHDGEREGRISTQEPERLVPPLAAAPCAPRPDGMDARGPVAEDVRRGGRLPRGRGRSRFLPQINSTSDSGSSTHDFVACHNGRRGTNEVGVGMSTREIRHWLRSMDSARGS